MNPNNRGNTLRNSTPYSRHISNSQHQSRPNHPPRWPMNHIPFTKDYQPCYNPNSGDHDKEVCSYPKPHGAQSPISFPPETNSPPDLRQLSPPLHVPRLPQVPDSSVQIRGPLLSLSPTLLAASMDPQVAVDFSTRRSSHQTDLRHSPLQHSPPYFRANGQEEGRKSESPSRKRRRLVQTPPLPSTVHHHTPHHHASARSPRRNQRHQPPRGSPPIRRLRFGECIPQDIHPWVPRPHSATFTHHPYVHSHATAPAPPIVMDVTQVPVSLPLPLYNGGPTPAQHLPSCQVHSIYCTAPPQHPCQIYDNMNGLGGCVNHHGSGHHHSSPHHHHHHHHTSSSLGFIGTPPHSPSGFSPVPQPPIPAHFQHLAPAPPPPPPPPRPDSIELDIFVDHHHHHHRSPPLLQMEVHPMNATSNIFISEVPRRASPRRWRSIPPNTPGFPGLLHFLSSFRTMFSNPPLSPYSQDLSSPESQPTENYEELLNLAERLGEAKPRGLNKMEIDQLPSFKFNSETHTGDQTSCVVCMCDFEPRQILRGLPCSHQFHAKCVDKWLKSNRTCPICRGDASGYFSNTD